MAEFGEAVAIPENQGHNSEGCPFCPLEKKKDSSKIAKIGKDNNSNTLGTRLDSSGDQKDDHLYEDSEHGQYSAEAHHLICGNEILGDNKEVEKFLITEDKKTTKGANGYISQDLHDVDWDVNNARNGIWLPSVPDKYRKIGDQEPSVWWGKQTKKSGRISLTESQRQIVAFLVMEKEKRQFHKGPHGNVGEPHDNYVELGLNEMKKVKAFLVFYSNRCPMEANGSARSSPPYYPPHGLATVLDLLSKRLKKELVGHPRTWTHFISEYARECTQWFNSPTTQE